jgi:hypothetical protein
MKQLRNLFLLSLLLTLINQPSTAQDRIDTLSTRLPANHPDGPYILYADGNHQILRVDEAGHIIIHTYATLPEPFSFEVLSDANHPDSSARSRFTVTLGPLQRPDWQRPAPDSLIVISDVHAKWEPFVSILRAQHVIDDQLRWTFGNNELMINGDIFDRGDDATTCLWLTYKLQQEARKAGGEVHFLYGNHEEMVLRDNLKYTNTKYTDLAAAYSPTRAAHYGSLFFNTRTELGQWLGLCNTLQIIGTDLFVHAGLNQTFYDNNYNIPDLNLLMSRDILKTSGRNSFLFGSSSSTGGPLWYRGMVPGYSSLTPLPATTLRNLLRRYSGTERVIIGHTEVSSSSITVERSNHPIAYSANDFDYRVLNVNVPTATAYKRYGRGILVLPSGITQIIYDNAPSTPLPLPTRALTTTDLPLSTDTPRLLTTCYFSLLGQRTLHPAPHRVYLVRRTYDNGQTTVSKALPTPTKL